MQTISGTGANHLAALFLSKYYQFNNGNKVIYLSDPTWGTCRRLPPLVDGYLKYEILRARTANHNAIFKNVGIEQRPYPYYDPKTIGLDFDGFIATLKSAPERSVFLLHACAHNPTGVDPTEEQWKTIAGVFLAKKHYAFFDSAYQGFASGDLDRDAAAVRHFVSSGVPMLVCQVRSSKFTFLVPKRPQTGADRRALPKMPGCTVNGWARSTSYFRTKRLRAASAVNCLCCRGARYRTLRRTVHAW